MIRRTLLVALLPAVAAAAACGAPAQPHPAVAGADPHDTTLVWDANAVGTRAELLNPDAVKREVMQHYPTLLHDAGVVGWANVQVVISRDGTVERAVVVEASNEMFSDAARAVAMRMRFRPATVGGVPVRVRDTVPVRFDLQG
jgi:TonB family protein